MMAYLNGVAIPDLLSLRTLIAKYVSLSCHFMHMHSFLHPTTTRRDTMTCHACMWDCRSVGDSSVDQHPHMHVCQLMYMTQYAPDQRVSSCFYEQTQSTEHIMQVGGHMLLGER